MFGKEYRNHLDILTQSFGQINKQYQKRVQTNKNSSTFIEKLKKLYILLFGIPEIGFQIRTLYFKKILITHIIKRDIKNVLDAGSGIGAYSFWLGKTFTHAKILGGDIDKNKLQSCKELRNELHRENVTFSYLDITKLRNNAAYDLIIAIDALEHIEKYGLVLKNFYRLLRNNGYLYIHVPQPNQKRIFPSFNAWRHQNHIREGIAKNELEKTLKVLGFKITVSRETFGFFGKLTWELNHLMLSGNFVLAGITFPFLYLIARMDMVFSNNGGLGVALLAKKVEIKSRKRT